KFTKILNFMPNMAFGDRPIIKNMKTSRWYFFDFKKIFKYFVGFSLLLFIAFSFVGNVNASWLDTVNTGGLEEAGGAYNQGSSDSNSLILTIASIVQVSLSFLGIIFLVLLIWAGFNWMTAGGEEEKITKATDTIKSAVIGLIIVLASFAIASFVISKIVSSTT
ncbi:MAG: pilin, partial [Patescibacteria group bacterium]